MDDIAKYIEHTNLNPLITVSDVDRLAHEAIEINCFGLCVPPFWVKRARREIGNSKLTLVTVVGFPLGYQMTETKLDEIQRAIDNGVDEIDVVWNLSAFKSGFPWTKIELAKCAKLAHASGKMLKVIIETSYLNDSEIVEGCKICADSGADFVKTSTGFASGGASADHVALMRNALPSSVGIKASGGINKKAIAMAMLEAGADRIGTSAGVEICKKL
ncbi:MAG: deoxyribose-phosphate aldolase [Cyclobacteriaceae bacterium]